MPKLRIVYSYPEPNYVVRWTRWICLTAAAVCFLWGGLVWLDQYRYQAEAEESFEDRQVGATPEQPARKAVPLAKLEIARLHVSGYVQDGFDNGTLRRAIGHSPRSAKPGERGNIVLAAHRDTFFAGLRNARVGDVVDLRSSSGALYRYRVTRILVVEPKDDWVMKSSANRNLLTLITCYPFHFIGSAPKRFVVQAQPVSPLELATTSVRTGFRKRSEINAR